jgi:hypothetical protein
MGPRRVNGGDVRRTGQPEKQLPPGKDDDYRSRIVLQREARPGTRASALEASQRSACPRGREPLP